MHLNPALRTVVWLLVLQAALVFAFVYPSYKPSPQGLPVGVVGSPAAAQALTAKDADLDVTAYPSEHAARDAIDNREIYGAVAGERVLVAPAASFTVAQLLRGAFPTLHAVDVKPLDADDPRGATINLVFLPLIGVCFSVTLALAALRLRRRTLVAAATAFAVLGGMGVAAVLHDGLGSLPGSFAGVSAVIALTVLAVLLPTLGLQRLFGSKGIGLAGVLFLVFANPASGNGTAPELLPGVWRHLGQLLPPGAGGTALRNVSYFDGNALARPLLVLATFALGGLALIVWPLLHGSRRSLGFLLAEREASELRA